MMRYGQGYHRLRGSSALLLRVTSHFNGRTQNLTPVYPKPFNFSEPKFAQMITSGLSDSLLAVRSCGTVCQLHFD